MQNMYDKDRTADIEEQPTWESNIHHISAIPQLSKDRTADILEDTLKQVEDTNLTVTKTSHDTQTANRRDSTQCNNGTETNSDYA